MKSMKELHKRIQILQVDKVMAKSKRKTMQPPYLMTFMVLTMNNQLIRNSHKKLKPRQNVTN